MTPSSDPHFSSGSVMGFDPKALLGRAMKERQESGAGADRIGDYHLIQRLAQGGMGVVYLARHVSLQRIVALKMIRSGHLATTEETDRFRREAEAAASLDHPNIVPIYEIGEDGGRHFFSMKLMEGGNLAELSADCAPERRGSSEWMRHAAALVATMARAMHHAHQRGVLHRDVKPTNVLLDEHGQPHLTDFGLAKVAEAGPGMTQTIAVMGTPSYMAPEQAAGHARGITAAADVYSLGAVLYELLSGYPPFKADSTLELLKKVQESEPPTLRKANRRLPRDLETICFKCLHKEPGRRYVSAEELAADLNRWMAGKPIHARPAGWPERLWLWCRRNPAAVVIGALLIFTTVRARSSSMRMAEQRDKINQALGRSQVAHAHSLRLSGVAGRRAESLAVLAQAARIRPSLEVRNEVIAALALTDLGPPETWRASVPEKHWHALMLTDQYDRYAIFGEHEGITIHRRGDGEILAELKTPPNMLFLGKFSPDGRWLLAYDRDLRVFLWDLTRAGRGPHPHTLTISQPSQKCAEFTPDSKSLAIAGQDRHFHLYSLPSGKETIRFDLGMMATGIRFDAAGEYLALSGDSQIRVWNMPKREPAGQFAVGFNGTDLAWHPQGRYVALGGDEGNLLYVDRITGGIRWLPRETQTVNGLDFDPLGGFLASVSWEGVYRYWDPPTGRLLFETKHGGTRVTGDGRYVVMFDEGGGIVAREITRSTVFRSLSSARTGHPKFSGTSLHPDGRWLVSGGYAGVHFWDAAKGSEAAVVVPEEAARPCFHPGGHSVIYCSGGRVSRMNVSVVEDGGSLRTGETKGFFSVPGESFSEARFAPDGESVVIAGRHCSYIVKWGDPSQYITFAKGAALDHVRLSPDNRWVASATFYGDGVTVWDGQTGARTQHLIKTENAMLAFSPDGRTLATGTVREVVLWDTGTWQARHRIPLRLSGAVPVPVGFSRDGTWLAAATTGTGIEIINARTGEPAAALTPPVPLTIASLSFSPDDRHLAAFTLGPAAQLWDLEALHQELRPLGLEW